MVSFTFKVIVPYHKLITLAPFMCPGVEGWVN